jgi:HAMP domain-containing protein
LPQMPMLGIYPTLETTLAQGLMIVALIAALIWLWNGAPARANARRA